MKRSPQRTLELQPHSNARRQSHDAPAARDRGVSRWRALEREQFEALTASPSPEHGGPEGGSESC